MEVTEAPSVHRATELVCQFYQQFIYKAFIPKYLSQSIYPKVFIPKYLSQSIYPKVFIKNLYATPPLLIVPSAPPRHCVYLRHLRDIAFYLRPLRSSVCLLYKTFSLSPHISEEPKISHIYLEYRGQIWLYFCYFKLFISVH